MAAAKKSNGKGRLRILFIGNSHTYYHDMPEKVRARVRQEGTDCEVTMLAHPGWYLKQHVQEPEVRFNIKYGDYDYVVLQEHSHPFGPAEDYRSAVLTLTEWIREAGARTVLFETWAREDDEEGQAEMDRVNQEIAEETGALLAPVGEMWWPYLRSWPNHPMYEADGAHPSEAGSDFAAKMIYETILRDRHRRERDGDDPRT